MVSRVFRAAKFAEEVAGDEEHIDLSSAPIAAMRSMARRRSSVRSIRPSRSARCQSPVWRIFIPRYCAGLWGREEGQKGQERDCHSAGSRDWWKTAMTSILPESNR